MSSGPTAQVTFVTEIMQMMHGFGDGLRSNPDAAFLIEEIVHHQMTSLLAKAVDSALNRQVDQIGLEDVLFTLRKDKIKLSRLYNNLYLKDSIDMMNRVVPSNGPIQGGSFENSSTAQDPLFGPASLNTPQPSLISVKRVKICRDFFASIDETGEYEALLSDELQDEIKHARKVRQEELSRNLSESEYDKFCECRRISFSPLKKFAMWLLNGQVVDGIEMRDLKINNFALEAFSYLSYETVGEIVDMCLLVKQGLKSEPGNEVPALVSLKMKPTRAIHSSFHSSLPTTYCQMPASVVDGIGHGIFNQTQANGQSTRSLSSGPALNQQLQEMTSTISPSDVLEVLRRFSSPTTAFSLMDSLLVR